MRSNGQSRDAINRYIGVLGGHQRPDEEEREVIRERNNTLRGERGGNGPGIETLGSKQTPVNSSKATPASATKPQVDSPPRSPLCRCRKSLPVPLHSLVSPRKLFPLPVSHSPPSASQEKPACLPVSNMMCPLILQRLHGSRHFPVFAPGPAEDDDGLLSKKTNS